MKKCFSPSELDKNTPSAVIQSFICILYNGISEFRFLIVSWLYFYVYTVSPSSLKNGAVSCTIQFFTDNLRNCIAHKLTEISEKNYFTIFVHISFYYNDNTSTWPLNDSKPGLETLILFLHSTCVYSTPHLLVNH